MPVVHACLQICVCSNSNLTSIIANRKKAEARKTGGGPPPLLAEAEEMALSQNCRCPIAEGISGKELIRASHSPGHKALGNLFK